MEGLGSAYRRWRHTRGFGVHSPLAFLLVENVVRSRGEYYAYPDIDLSSERSACGRGYGKLRRRARMLHRLAARMPVVESRYLGEVPEAYRRSVALAGISRGSGAVKLTVAVAPGQSDRAALLEAAAEAGNVVVVFNAPAELLAGVERAVESGVVLRGRDSLIAVSRQGVAAVSYTVRL